eukprot:GHVS01035975.1.p1 GENE.GHVS01035975.1~~GHVS01035975.1.p1  ORF type:complete len:161 (+),score=9.45 GHVS01035975.1:310-792(+)
MANRSLDLVDAASAAGDVINYKFAWSYDFKEMLRTGGFTLKTSIAGDKYGVKSDEDINGTIFHVLILIRNGGEELGKLLKEHIAGIRSSLKNNVVRIGGSPTSLAASILVDMPEVTAMNKDTFMRIVKEVENKYTKILLLKGNMAAIAARAKKIARDVEP